MDNDENKMQHDRLPPHNRSAEMSVLGSCLRDNHAIDDVATLLRPPDFYLDAHQVIFEAVVAVHNKGKPVDTVVLADVLRADLDRIGSYPYLAELWDCAPTAANAVHYAGIVRELSLARGLIQAGTEMVRAGYDRNGPMEEILAEAEQAVLGLAEVGCAGESVTLETALAETYDRIDARREGTVSGLPTGYADLDEILCGLQESEMVLIGARPSVGKTAFALNLIRNIAINQGEPLFFVSLEQSRTEVVERLLCSDARVDSHRLRRGTISPDDMDRLIKSGSRMRKRLMFIDDTTSQTMLRIAANARRLRRKHGIKAVVIDYLQLIETERSGAKVPRQEQVADISRRLKFLARELKIPVITLAQVNRGLEERADHRPRLSDLRESGALEQDSDVVMMLHRPERYQPGQLPGVTEVIIAKQRNGRTGEINLTFLAPFMRFENFAMGIPFDDQPVLPGYEREFAP